MRELQRFFATPLPSATELAQKLGMHSFEVEEVEGEGELATITIDVLPNRGADALSHRGVAREVSAVARLALHHDPLATLEPQWEPQGTGVRVICDENAPCERYIALLIEGVRVGPSPAWVQETLSALGMRSINTVVDATNLAMMRVGQPLHAFAAEKLERDSDGAIALSVRHAAHGERVVLLGGEEVSVAEGVPLVEDAVAKRPIAIAGVKGGAHAEVDEHTTTIVLEAAHFPAPLIRRAVRTLGFTTDAAQRFQHNPSLRLPAYGVASFLELLREMGAGGDIRAVAQWYPTPEPAPQPIEVPHRAFAALCGREFTPQEVCEVLEWLGCEVNEVKEGVWRVVPPWERRDLRSVEDVVEEVVRILGYDSLPPTPLTSPVAPPPADPLQYGADQLRLALAREGFTELMTYTLRPHGEVCVANALAADKRCLRTNVREGLREALERNAPFAPLAGGTQLAVFEIGEVVRARQGATPPWEEALHIGLGVAAGGKKARARARERLDRAVELIERITGPLSWEVEQEGLLREARIDTALRRCGVEEPYTLDLWNPHARYRPLIPYPVVVRDIAVWVPEGLSTERIREVIVQTGGPLVRRVDCIDEYEREGRRSLAFRVVLQADDHTLSDDEANAVVGRIAEALSALGCTLR